MSAPRCVLSVEGTISEEQLKEFRRLWHAQVSGNFNAWRTPLIVDKLEEVIEEPEKLRPRRIIRCLQ